MVDAPWVDMSGDRGDGTHATSTPGVQATSEEQPRILVVGDGVIPAAAACFLDRVGLTPGLAASTSSRPQTNVRMLWEPALTLLGRIGLREPIEQVGTPVRGVRCLTTDDEWTIPDTRSPSLLAVTQSRLHSVIRRQLPAFGAEQLVTAIEPERSGVRVTFEGTTTELFDGVITRSNTHLSGQTQALSAQTIDSWAFACSETVTQPGLLTEAWDEQLAAFSVPLPQGRVIQLVATVETTPSAALTPESLAERFGHLVDGTPFDGLDRRDLRYRRIPCVMPRRLTSAGIALAGGDAHFTVPGDCLGTTLGIEDAWVLADTVASGSADIESALARYATRRRRRRSALVGATLERTGRAGGPTESHSMLGHLSARRRLAFEHIVGQSLPAVAHAVPDTR